MKSVGNGKIIPNGVSLEKHEYDTVLFLTTLGWNISLIRPSMTPGKRTPDFKSQNLEWEMKSPKGKSRSTLEHAFQSAAKQSNNIIFDLRRTPIPEEKSLTILEKLMNTSKTAKRLCVITKKQKLLWYSKNGWVL
ncbi:hypothetical protein IJI55_02690 [Candidatus Saccharibacteria bacterium]|nr:hypothetical protein [Candidatus Saccharibacteria bacterium]